ncbi:uncharacterized protein EAE98_000952 [Botrytis deweyae]|uniref:Uncharacterized protein n=1 Tax=Botrytis deweyae TaxID=2478750 RepID=A0ABQ7J0B7_9HELO|nr:uncharacterized protein EAE98_000952 [Botrytis deweyae]KAF7938614.1 hypothetical protein EAE98_000952 [Botrytis deweyae]
MFRPVIHRLFLDVALSKRLFCLVGLPCLCLTGKLPSPLLVYPVSKGSLHINMDLPPEALYPSHPPTLIAFDTKTSQLLSIKSSTNNSIQS